MSAASLHGEGISYRLAINEGAAFVTASLIATGFWLFCDSEQLSPLVIDGS